MGMILDKKQDLDDEISRRIATDLREKTTQGLVADEKTPDFVEDSDYAKDFRKTSRFSLVWVVLGLLVVIVGLVVAFRM